MLRSLSSERLHTKPQSVETAEKWPKKQKPKGLKRRKSVTQIGTEEIVDQIETYICHLERTIEDQRIFIKSLLEENRMLKLKRKLRAKISDKKECLSEERRSSSHQLKTTTARTSKETVPITKNKKASTPQPLWGRKRVASNEQSVLERVMDTKNLVNRHPVQHPNPCSQAIKRGSNTSSSQFPKHSNSHNALSKVIPSQAYLRHGKDTKKAVEQTWIQRWLEEDDDDHLWSDY